jgi:hypothetical protein
MYSLDLFEIAQPLRLKMDFLKENDRIEDIFCGWFQTFIRTHRGKIYQTTVNTEKRKKKVVEEKDLELSDDEEVKKESEEAFKYKNKRRKKTEEFYGTKEERKNREHHKRYEGEVKWV